MPQPLAFQIKKMHSTGLEFSPQIVVAIYSTNWLIQPNQNGLVTVFSTVGPIQYALGVGGVNGTYLHPYKKGVKQKTGIFPHMPDVLRSVKFLCFFSGRPKTRRSLHLFKFSTQRFISSIGRCTSATQLQKQLASGFSNYYPSLQLIIGCGWCLVQLLF